MMFRYIFLLFFVAIFQACTLNETKTTTQDNQFATQKHDATTNVRQYYQISPALFAKYTADLGVTDNALTSFLKILARNKAPRSDLDANLSQIAKNYRTHLTSV